MNVWLYGLISALVTGFIGGLGSALADIGASTTIDLRRLLITSLIAALVGVGAYLKQSPIVPSAPPLPLPPEK